MNDPQGLEAQAAGFDQILLNHGLDVARGYSVEVEDVREGDAQRLVRHFLQYMLGVILFPEAKILILKYIAMSLTLVLVPLGAADFWEVKDSKEWSEKQVRRMLTDSPWAQLYSITLDARTGGALAGGMEDAGNSPTKNSDGTRAVGAGYGGMDVPKAPTANLILRWHSALPLKQAIARHKAMTNSAAQAETTATAEQSYLLGIEGIRSGMLPRGEAAEVTKNLRLKIKNKPELQAAGIKFDPKTRILYIAFPRGKDGGPVIEASDGEVEVDLKLGSKKVSRKFRLKDMMYKGKLEI